MAPSARFRCVHCGGDVPIASADVSPLRCPACNASFAVDAGVIELTSTSDDRDYPEALIDLVADVEQRHFWFAARNDVILSTTRRVIGTLTGKRLLDIGCGTGFVLSALERAGLDGCGIDMHRAALRRARARVRGPLFWSNATALPFFPDFDIVALFDVIEHVDDDVSVLRQARGVLTPTGFVVVTVPAGPTLWTAYDEVIGHKRRYERDGLADALRRSGFEVCAIEYFNCLPLLALTLQRRLTSTSPQAGDAVEVVRRALRVPPEPINALLRLLIRAEAPLRSLQWVRGGSLIAVARRSGRA